MHLLGHFIEKSSKFGDNVQLMSVVMEMGNEYGSFFLFLMKKSYEIEYIHMVL